MKVTMLDTVEDSNFHQGDKEAGREPEHAISQRAHSVGGEVVGCYRVDLLHKDQEYDLPKDQAQHLIELGLAQGAAQ